MRVGRLHGRLAVVLLALPLPTCNQAIMTAPAGSTISLFARPTTIPAHGGIAVISAFVIEPSGAGVPDGTVVQFFTNLGTIDEQGKTNDGVARVNLRANGRSGEASISAFSGQRASSGGTGSETGTVKVAIGNFAAASVLVTADPPVINASRSSSQIRATVFDGDGNPLAGIPVFFDITAQSTVGPPPTTSTTTTTTTTSTTTTTTTSSTSTTTTTTTTTTLPPPVPPPPGEANSLDSAGAPQFTDNTGRAFDVLRTRNVVSGQVVVRARVPKGGADAAEFVAGEVIVEIIRD